ncbi:uncharacterized protein PGTG_22565 [Puccinia graminis f. sp. tritici CRL 75-36-700-3]|uniref:Uncharacterized protein n=1 Tax=Puccinia graminis f. sp. tritici (strain CRL 75-36-700-3 / race SCCL) TaxID=418459 RepID=H6QUX8_PUCGT|nr:uncharacterized protein PGTG_22565 [Puccinia graminis f. sp. tritici CRL 75-36-700-3]EHS62591.1 hypothetical protein PGTG_22565 [Puccinia graminis f. sp. tritici CRL 75-36-700-3]
MTIKDKAGTEFEEDFKYHQTPGTRATIMTNKPNNSTFEQFILQYQTIRDHVLHAQLQQDIINHL